MVLSGETLDVPRILDHVQIGEKIHLRLEVWKVTPHFYDSKNDIHHLIRDQLDNRYHPTTCEIIYRTYTHKKTPFIFEANQWSYPVDVLIGEYNVKVRNLRGDGPVFYGVMEVTAEMLENYNTLSLQVASVGNSNLYILDTDISDTFCRITYGLESKLRTISFQERGR